VVSGLQFQKKSDWGSRFAGESLMYTITVISPTGTINSGGLQDVVVTDQLPTNLEVAGPIQVSDQNARVEQQGNQITVRVGTLPAGQTLTIMIPVKIKADVAAQTRIVNQAQLRYAGITDPMYSNIASVLVVGAPPPLTATAIANAVAATPNPATVTPGVGAGGGIATTTAGVSQTNVGQSNPATSAGIPVLGFVLFGLTLLVHNVRVRRELTRI
jgi:fimbrial isopeptide formation D2 family protein